MHRSETTPGFDRTAPWTPAFGRAVRDGRGGSPDADLVAAVLAEAMDGRLRAGWPRVGGGWTSNGVAILRVGEARSMLGWRIGFQVAAGRILHVDRAIAPDGRRSGYAELGNLLDGMGADAHGRVGAWLDTLGTWH